MNRYVIIVDFDEKTVEINGNKYNNLENISLCPNTINYTIPECPTSQSFFNEAVGKDYRYLEFVPLEFQTSELCELACEQSGYALKYIKNQTRELCWKAVKNNGKAYQYVNKEFKCDELCKIAISEYPEMIQYYKGNNLEYYVSAVSLDGSVLRFIDVIYQTTQVCTLAVKKDKENVKFIKNYNLKKLMNEFLTFNFL